MFGPCSFHKIRFVIVQFTVFRTSNRGDRLEREPMTMEEIREQLNGFVCAKRGCRTTDAFQTRRQAIVRLLERSLGSEHR
jgi:hypothetical protein